MNLSAPFILRPVMTTFVMLAIVILGWFSYNRLSVSDVPTIEKPSIQVRTGYPGASPEDVLNQVTIPLEKELAQVKGVKQMSSSSSSGSSRITLDFDLSKDMNVAVRDVQSAINRAESQLPSDIDPRPTYKSQEGAEFIMHLLLMSERGDVSSLRRYADTYLLPQLSRIEGLAEVEVFGSGNSIWVRLNPERMAARKIGFNEVIDTVRSHTEQMPLGKISSESKSFSIELPATIRQGIDLKELHIGTSGVRLKDIADISEENVDKSEFYLLTKDERIQTIMLGIKKVNDGNTVAVAKAVEAVVKGAQKNLPADMQLQIWFDKSLWIEESIVDVEWSLFFAFLLVIAVIYLSLGRLSEALIPSAALPLSIVGTFSFMLLFDFSLDLLSLLALTLSVGFVVDDAIVVLENIVRHQEKGKSAFDASMDGSKQICFTVLSMTLSLIAVFIPLLFMEGMNGRLLRAFSVTLAVSILVSGFISLSLIPMLCSRFLPEHTSKQTRVQRAVGALNSTFVAIYEKSLRWTVGHSKSVLSIAFLAVMATIPLFIRLSVDLVPSEDRGLINVYVNLPSGISAEEIKVWQSKLEERIKHLPDIKDILDINYEGNILLLVRLKPLAERRPQDEIVRDIKKNFASVAGIHAHVNPYQLIHLEFDMSGSSYKYYLRGHNFDDVNAHAEELANVLKEDAAYTSVSTLGKNDAPQLAVKVNEEYAHRLGVDKKSVQDLLRRAYGQSSIGKIQRGVQSEKIYMELQERYRLSPSGLSKLYMTTPSGISLPLKAVASWEEKLGAPKLNQRDQLPSAVVRFNLEEGKAAQQALQRVEDLAEDLLPTGVTGSLSDSAKAVTSAMQNTLLLLAAAALVMYLVLGILYESFIHPLTILSSLPFAALGGVLTLTLFNEPVSIFSAVGFLLLIGIVKKNGIMMIDYALEARRRGACPEEAIIEGCLVRFRPIMMTTIAAIMGALPIAIGFGEGAEMRKGLGLVIVGGLLFAQVLTLYVTPLLYLFFDKLSNKIMRQAECAVS